MAGSQVTRHQEILFGVTGQSFVFDAPDGRPSNPVVTVHAASADDDGTAETATTGAASVDAVDTTLASEGAAGSSTLVLADVAGIVKGRRYLLDAVGLSEHVEVLAIDAGADTVTLRHPLLNTHATGATLQGCRMSIAVAPAWSSTQGKVTDGGYRVRWVYEVNGEATIGVGYASLVRYRAQNLVTALDVDRRFPGFIDRLPPDHREDQGAALIGEAFNAVRFDALGDAQVLRKLRDTEVLADLVKHRALVLAIEHQIMAGAANMLDALKVATDAYDKRYLQLIREPKVPFDATGEGAASAGRRAPIWRR